MKRTGLILLIALCMPACGDRVTLESADRVHALTYQCDRFEPAVASSAKEAILRTHSHRIARQVAQQNDSQTLDRLLQAYENPDPRQLEKLVVDYVCDHGVPAEEVRVPVFPEPGSAAREFVLRQLTFEPPYDDGPSVRLSDYRGQVVVLDFFAIWCAPCIEKYPALAELAGEYGQKGVRFFGIIPHDAPRSVAVWLLENGGVPPYPFLVAHDEAGFKRAWRTHAVPEMFVIDPTGYIADHCFGCQTGSMSTDSLPGLLDSLLSRVARR